MAFSRSNLLTQKLFSYSVVLVIFTTFFPLLATKLVNSQKTVSFNLNLSNPRDPKLILQGDAMFFPDPHKCLSMTAIVHSGVGRVLYSSLVPIWDSTTGNVASFETSFSFRVIHMGNYPPGDGLIFFLTDQLNATIPKNSDGGLLGVADANNAFNRFVGVEYDNHVNPWDPNYTHIGIDLNSLYSTKTMKWRYNFDSLVTITIIYNSLSSTLTVFATDEDGQNSTLSQQLDLKWLLPEMVVVGISASSGTAQSHEIYSWSFTSVLDTTTRSSSDNINNITASY